MAYINQAVLSCHDWQPSPVTGFMRQAMIAISDDIQLCVEIGGNPKAPPLLMIMGLGSQLTFWPEGFVKRLIDAGFFVIRFDNRDIGLSTKVTSDLPQLHMMSAMLRMQVGLDNSNRPVPYKLIDLADDSARLMGALGIHQAHILGASMGGMVAQILSARYPHLVNRLALLFSTNNRPFLPPPRPRQLETLLKKPASHNKEDIIKHGQWFIGRIGSQGHVDEQMVADAAQLRYERCFYPAGSVQQLAAILSTGNLRHFSQEIKAPTLVLHGSEDGLVPCSHGKALAKDIPKAKFMLIKGMAHDLPSYYQPFIVQQLKRHYFAQS